MPLRSIEEWLDALAQLRARNEEDADVPVPRVTLHLSSGRAISGSVLRVGETRRGRTVVLHEPGPDPRRPEHDAVVVALASIEALTLHDAAALAPPPNAPTRLELLRAITAREGVLAARVGAPFTLEVEAGSAGESEDGRRVIAELLEEVSAAIEATAADDLGAQALRKVLTKVTLAVGSAPFVGWVDGVFVARAKAPGGLQRAEIRGALEQGL
ncbi:MAG: hypothetical protein IT384_15485 [Deltaproteobacteria bacterium]|nr:hypothetical protein [Deltaproteobacteria bacterium]